MEKRRKYDPDFREGAVQLVREMGRPIAQIARELGVNEGTLGNWVAKDREARAADGEAHRESRTQHSSCRVMSSVGRVRVVDLRASQPASHHVSTTTGSPQRGDQRSVRSL